MHTQCAYTMIVLRGSTLLLQRCSTHRQTITSLRPRVAPGSTMCDQLHQTESQKSPPNHMIKRAAPFDKQVWLSSLLSLFPIPSIPGRFQRNATSLNLKITEEKTREWPDFFVYQIYLSGPQLGITAAVDD